jgi:DNA-binding XRE family transcriptional regulator
MNTTGAHDEDADDAAIYAARKAELAGDPSGLLPGPVSSAMLKGQSRFKALRRWRGLTQSALATKSGIGQGYLSDIENRRRTGAPETLERLARALDVPLKWIA